MKKHFVAILPLIFVAACGNDQSSQTKQDTAKKDTTVGKVEVIDESDNTLPSPMIVAEMFKQSGMKYLPGLINTTEKASNYSTTFSKAENMGVYSADMAYCVLNKQSSDGKNLLKTIRDLGTQINLGKVFDKANLFDRFNNNIDKEDSIGKIVADIQYETDMQLDQDQQHQLYGIIFSGAWVESIYLGSQVYLKDGTDNLTQSLMQQLAVLSSILKELKNNKDKDANIPALMADLQQIQDAIDNMPSVKKLKDNPDLDFSDVKPTRDELTPVINKISEIRTKIING